MNRQDEAIQNQVQGPTLFTNAGLFPSKIRDIKGLARESQALEEKEEAITGKKEMMELSSKSEAQPNKLKPILSQLLAATAASDEPEEVMKEKMSSALKRIPPKLLGAKTDPRFPPSKQEELAKQFDLREAPQSRPALSDWQAILKPYRKLTRHAKAFFQKEFTSFVKGLISKAETELQTIPANHHGDQTGASPQFDPSLEKTMHPYFCWLYARSILQQYGLPLVDHDDKHLMKQDGECFLEQELAFRVASFLFFNQIQKGSSSSELGWMGNEDVQRFIATQKNLSMKQGMNLSQFFGQWTSDEESQRKKTSLRVYTLFQKASLESLSFAAADQTTMIVLAHFSRQAKSNEEDLRAFLRLKRESSWRVFLEAEVLGESSHQSEI